MAKPARTPAPSPITVLCSGRMLANPNGFRLRIGFAEARALNEALEDVLPGLGGKHQSAAWGWVVRFAGGRIWLDGRGKGFGNWSMTKAQTLDVCEALVKAKRLEVVRG